MVRCERGKQVMNVSVVIPSLNAPLIAEVLAALYQQTVAPSEIIVVGRDDERRIIRQQPVRFIETPTPVSAACARNHGAAQASGDIIWFLDADCLAHPQCLSYHVQAHERGEVVVGGGITFDDTQYWHLCDNLAVFTPFLATRPAGERPFLPSLNLSIRRNIFAELGGFDERFPGASGEDADLSFRMRRRGYRLFFEPAAIVKHVHHRLSSGDLWRHLSAFGRSYVAIYPRYPEFTGRYRRTDIAFGRPRWLRTLAPFLAVLDCIERYARYPELRAYPQTVPGLLLSRLAWYDGMARGMQR